jgi:phosphoribosylglycinamide formyltransferase-1
MFKVAVLASTRGTNFQSLIDAGSAGALKENVEISCLITNQECGAIEKAEAAGIPHHLIPSKGKTREVYDREVMKALEKYQPDLIVLGGYMRIVGPEMIGKYRNRMINVHPSLLPKYGGGMNLDVHRAVLDAGEAQTGMTIHLLDEGVDTGPIVLQKTCEVRPDDTPDALRDRVQALEKEWYPKVVQWFADGKVKISDSAVHLTA